MSFLILLPAVETTCATARLNMGTAHVHVLPPAQTKNAFFLRSAGLMALRVSASWIAGCIAFWMGSRLMNCGLSATPYRFLLTMSNAGRNLLRSSADSAGERWLLHTAVGGGVPPASEKLPE